MFINFYLASFKVKKVESMTVEKRIVVNKKSLYGFPAMTLDAQFSSLKSNEPRSDESSQHGNQSYVKD